MRLALAALALGACKPAPDDTGSPWRPDLACPGDEGCATAEGPLQAGFAVRSVVPACFESWADVDGDSSYVKNTDVFLDCGCDRLCPGEPGYVAPDAGEGDGVFQAIWMAGFGHGRAAMAVRDGTIGLAGEGDGLWARAVALRQGETTAALVAIDSVGIFYDDTVRIREAVAALGLDVDHVIVHATHDHQSPDAMGLWGPSLLRSGYDEAYMAQVRGAAAEAVGAAVAALEPVDRLVLGASDSSTWHEKGTRNVINDLRDPYVVDERIQVAGFRRADGTAIGTIVTWGSHPEAMADRNTLLTSDFVHALRKGVESGVRWQGSEREGTGAPCVYVNGAVGGMMSPLSIDVEDPDGNVWKSGSWEKADAIGLLVAEMALDALASGESVTELPLAVRAQGYDLPVLNRALQATALSGVIARSFHGYDPAKPLDDEENIPYVSTQASVLEVGPLQLATVPGELFPELAIGGYDGSRINAPGVAIFEDGNPNPPDLAAAPAGPYLLDRFTRPWPWIVGLGNDELGYIIPPYDFQVDPVLPYLQEVDGDHYEETNSAGPDTAPLVEAEVVRLLTWAPAEQP